jgi:hypothetical protein
LAANCGGGLLPSRPAARASGRHFEELTGPLAMHALNRHVSHDRKVLRFAQDDGKSSYAI